MLDAMNNARTRPEAQSTQKGKQQQDSQQGRNATGDTMLLQAICQRIEQKAHQPANDERQKDGRKITEKQEADQNCCQQQSNIM